MKYLVDDIVFLPKSLVRNETIDPYEEQLVDKLAMIRKIYVASGQYEVELLDGSANDLVYEDEVIKMEPNYLRELMLDRIKSELIGMNLNMDELDRLYFSLVREIQ